MCAIKAAHDADQTLHVAMEQVLDHGPPRPHLRCALPAAVQIFKDRGVEVDFQPKLGSDKDKLAEIIGNFDGLAIRSATKVTPKIWRRRKASR